MHFYKMLLNEYRSYETFVSCLLLIPVCVHGQGVMIVTL